MSVKQSATFVLLLAAPLAFGQSVAQKGELKCFDLHVGQVGRFPEQDNFNFFTVYRILSGTEMVVGLANFRSPLYPPPASRFLLRGVPTANLIDGKRLELKAVYSVTGTKF